MILTHLKRLAKGTAIYGSGQILNRFIYFLLLPIFTSYLSPEEYGINAILLVFSGILSCIFSFGIGVSTGIYYFIENNYEYRASIVWTANLILFLSVSLLMLFTLPNTEFISNLTLGSGNHKYLVRLTIITCSLGILTQPSILFLQFEEKAKLFVMISVIITVISLSGSIFFIVFLRHGVQGLIEAALLSQSISFFAFFSTMLINLKPHFNITLMKNLFQVGFPYVFGAATFFLLQYVNRYMLQIYHGLDLVGVYSVGSNIGFFVMLLTGSFSTAWTPFFNSFVNEQEKTRELFGQVLNYYIIGMGFICLCMFLFAKPVVILMTTAAFHDAYQVVGLIALAQMLYGCYLIFLPGLYYQKKTVWVNVIILMSCLMNIFLNALLIPDMKMLGAAIATLVCFLIMTASTYWSAKKYLSVNYNWLKIAKYALLWTIAVIVSWMTQKVHLTYQITFSILILFCFLSVNYFFLNIKEQSSIKNFLSGLFGSIIHINAKY